MLFSMQRRLPALLRSTPFGTRTYFAHAWDRWETDLGLRLLRVLRPEAQARSLGSIHFAYWVLIPRRHMRRLLRASGYGEAALARHEMLFLSEFSGDWEDYLVAFNQVLISALDLAWGASVGWQKQMHVNDYLRFVRRYQLHGQHHFQAYGDEASVGDVRDALQVSEQLERFVWETDGRDAEEFAAAFKRLRIDLGSSLAA